MTDDIETLSSDHFSLIESMHKDDAPDPVETVDFSFSIDFDNA